MGENARVNNAPKACPFFNLLPRNKATRSLSKTNLLQPLFIVPKKIIPETVEKHRIHLKPWEEAWEMVRRLLYWFLRMVCSVVGQTFTFYPEVESACGRRAT